MNRFFAALCVVLCPLPAWAKTFSCSTGDVACLITSITEANANGKKNTINLKAGTYALTTADNGDIGGETGLPQITSTLTINGKGPDVTILERSETAPSFRLLSVAETGDLTLEGLTIRHGQESNGSGLENRGGVVTISDTIFTDNRSAVKGGGLENRGGVVTISDTIFTDNRSEGEGGGLANSGGTVSVADSVFSHNGADHRGGLFNRDGTVTITRSTFAHNGAFDGGALGSVGGTVTISDSAFIENSAPADAGVVEADGGQTWITNSTIANSAGVGIVAARLFSDTGGTVHILNSTISGNIGIAGGGGAAA